MPTDWWGQEYLILLVFGLVVVGVVMAHFQQRH